MTIEEVLKLDVDRLATTENPDLNINIRIRKNKVVITMYTPWAVWKLLTMQFSKVRRTESIELTKYRE